MVYMHVHSTIGALLVGSFLAIFLSGTVSMQTVLYFTLYHEDSIRIKSIVALIWILDSLHTSFICAANWEYLIVHWGQDSITDYIPWTIAVSIALTAAMTFVVQCFFAYRVYTVSRKNIYITTPIALFAFTRLAAASVTTTKMIKLESFTSYRDHYGWVFTLGLTLSAALDILVTASLCYFLRRSRTGFSSMDTVINTLTFWAVQNGALTCFVAVASLICWLTMPNLIFLGLHLIITKLYANALLATLNARKSIRLHQSSKDCDSMPVVTTPNFNRGLGHNHHVITSQSIPMTKVQINVDRTIETQSDQELNKGGI